MIHCWRQMPPLLRLIRSTCIMIVRFFIFFVVVFRFFFQIHFVQTALHLKNISFSSSPRDTNILLKEQTPEEILDAIFSVLGASYCWIFVRRMTYEWRKQLLFSTILLFLLFFVWPNQSVLSLSYIYLLSNIILGWTRLHQRVTYKMECLSWHRKLTTKMTSTVS